MIRMRIFVLLTLVFSLCVSLSVLAACEDPHIHVYNQQVATNEYLASEATCMQKALYYYSCACGDKGTETFEFGDFSEHTKSQEWSKNTTHHWKTCEIEGCQEKLDETEHSVADGDTCEVCRCEVYMKGLYFTLNNDGQSYSVEGMDNESAKIVKIPSVYNNKPVVSIGNYAFYGLTDLMRITIPDSILSIGYSAFEGCSSLESIIIPDSVTSIGDFAFYDCYNITSVTIGSNVTNIGDHAFDGCYKLIEVYNKSALDIIAGSLDNGYIGYYARNIYTPTSGASKLSVDKDGYIIYTDNNDIILVGYTGTQTDLVLPSNVTEIYQHAFYYCTSLTSITIPDSVTGIGDYAFYDCRSLTSVTIGDSVTSIGKSAFEYCGSLTSIVIPDSVTSIGNSAFEDCRSLTSITIGNGVTSIGRFAFSGCRSLTSITIGNGVTSIVQQAFFLCDNLERVFYTGTAEDWSEISIGAYNGDLTSATVYYYSESEPTDAGNYWHYVDGEATIWNNEE